MLTSENQKISTTLKNEATHSYNDDVGKKVPELDQVKSRVNQCTVV